MTYTAEKPPLPVPLDVVRQRIPGWGVDLDPNDRPSVPRERFDPDSTGAHWYFPERQPEKWPRERSIEHKFLTPVFGTACPPRGLSGEIRRFAYKWSEGRAAHWMLLMVADRVDALENHLRSLLSKQPDNPIAESGVMSELSHDGLRSRKGQKRADVRHQPIDALIVGAPWVLGGLGALTIVRAVLRPFAALLATLAGSRRRC